MSPLIDVTNTEVQSSFVPERKDKECSARGCTTFQRKRELLPDRGLCRCGDDDILGRCAGNVSDCQLKAIKMCNTRLRKASTSKDLPSHQESRKVTNEDGKSNSVYSMRVPPLPQIAADDVLSQAVQALSLNPVTIHTKPSTIHQGRHRHRLRNTPKKNGRSNSMVEAAVSCNGLPDDPPKERTENIRTPQQCGACGLEFTSLAVLTEHLAKHVYDGLYAARWITQAMSLVSSRQQLTSSDPLITTVPNVPNGRDDGNSLLQDIQPCPPSSSN